MAEKREQPFALEMPFGEALARFTQTKPKEIGFNDFDIEPRKKKMGRAPKPFQFDLIESEVAHITEAEVVGTGGLQDLLRRLQAELAESHTIFMDDRQLGELIRYVTRYDPNGGFEKRLARAFGRSFLDLFNAFLVNERR